jgi:hypothetical protein
MNSTARTASLDALSSASELLEELDSCEHEERHPTTIKKEEILMNFGRILRAPIDRNFIS